MDTSLSWQLYIWFLYGGVAYIIFGYTEGFDIESSVVKHCSNLGDLSAARQAVRKSRKEIKKGKALRSSK